IGGDALKMIEPSLEKAPASENGDPAERPLIQEYDKRKKRISLHDIMGEYEESGEGKGAEYGIRVHKDAQRIMNGLKANDDNDETERIMKIYESVKGAKIMTEIDCSLPVKDVVIAGRIDMLAVFDDHVEVHDFKTDMNRTNEPRYAIQMSVYAHSASSLGKPVKCIIDYVSQNTSVTVEIMGIDGIYEHVTLYYGAE
ncbi:MAG: PD-(D/E)XK nuclease family protein, partial [Methanomassiliicoccaceae archaeon]|nr:PD-(D/E)XK nuclease family protein [Methanomassiliicoccaceae archaeon]